MDGMPLTVKLLLFTNTQIFKCWMIFVKRNCYGRTPKDVVTFLDDNGIKKQKREYREDIEKGY